MTSPPITSCLPRGQYDTLQPHTLVSHMWLPPLSPFYKYIPKWNQAKPQQVSMHKHVEKYRCRFGGDGPTQRVAQPLQKQDQRFPTWRKLSKDVSRRRERPISITKHKYTNASGKSKLISQIRSMALVGFFHWWGAFILMWVPDIHSKNYKEEKNDANPVYQQCLTCQA